jgi:uncharacterized membrane protein YhaH (DUF805 family)
MTTGSTATTRSALERWSALGGAVYVVLFIVGAWFSFSGQPDTSKSQDKVIAYWKDGGHRDKVNIGWILVALGVLALLWFIAALRQRMRAADENGFLMSVATIGGVLYATTTLIAFSLETAIKTMSDDTFHHEVYPALIHAADDTGWVIHAAGSVGVASLIIAASIAAKRLGAISNGLAVVSIVVGVLSLGAIAFFPAFLIALWLLVASIAMFVRGGSATGSA